MSEFQKISVSKVLDCLFSSFKEEKITRDEKAWSAHLLSKGVDPT